MWRTPALFPSQAPSTCSNSSEASLLRMAQCCCGALRVQAEGEPEAVVVCHCRECQRRTGSAFGAAAFFAREAVHITGESLRYCRDSDAGRKLVLWFCPQCGSTVWWETERHPDRIAIALGAFADPGFSAPVRSVYERTRHRWVRLPDDIPAHNASRDGAQVARHAEA